MLFLADKNWCLFIHKHEWNSILQRCPKLQPFMLKISTIYRKSFVYETLQIYRFSLLGINGEFHDSIYSQLSDLFGIFLEFSNWTNNNLHDSYMVHRYSCKRCLRPSNLILSRILTVRRIRVYEKNSAGKFCSYF